MELTMVEKRDLIERITELVKNDMCVTVICCSYSRFSTFTRSSILSFTISFNASIILVQRFFV